jgi:thioredoxin-like negative regulator of GroEL
MQELTDLSSLPPKSYIYFHAEFVQDSVDLLEKLQDQKIYTVNLESAEDIADHFEVADVPKMILVQDSKIVDYVDGKDIQNYLDFFNKKASKSKCSDDKFSKPADVE